MMSQEELEQRLKQAIADAEVHLRDLTGTQDHYEAVVVSSSFEGKSLVEQHQLVYRALGEAMHGPIHALALKTLTPQQWAKKKVS